MGILRFEMKQYKNSIIVWALALSLLVIFMLQIFAGMIPEDTSSMALALEGNAMMEALGMSVENFLSPLGMFGFLSSFLMLAGAIHATNLGLSIITKEHMQNTADFLMTKPYSRKQIFFSKMAAAFCAIFIIAVAYFIGALLAVVIATGGNFDMGLFMLLYLAFPLIQIIFLLFGVLIGVIISRVDSTLPVSMGVSFGLYIIGMFSSVVNSDFARYFSPFKYFNNNYIMANVRYEGSYLILYLILLILSALISYGIYIKKDIKMLL